MTTTQPPSRALMDRDQVWQVIDAQRMNLAALLEQLPAGDWRQPSLCAGWTVRDVAAHLTLQQVGPGGAIAMMVRWRGSLERTIHDAARRRAAALPTGQIIAEIRGMAGSRRHTIGVTYLETLTDILVHGQDIAIPLGRHHDMPPPAAATAPGRAGPGEDVAAPGGQEALADRPPLGHRGRSTPSPAGPKVSRVAYSPVRPGKS